MCNIGSNDVVKLVKVSFVEETVFNVILSALRDHKMQERVLAAAVNTVPELVTFCSADKASRNQGSATMGTIRMSSYQRGKKPGEIQNSASESLTAGAPEFQGCKGCGGKCRSYKECWAYLIACRTCGTKGHVEKSAKARTIACLTIFIVNTISSNSSNFCPPLSLIPATPHPPYPTYPPTLSIESTPT